MEQVINRETGESCIRFFTTLKVDNDFDKAVELRLDDLMHEKEITPDLISDALCGLDKRQYQSLCYALMSGDELEAGRLLKQAVSNYAVNGLEEQAKRLVSLELTGCFYCGGHGCYRCLGDD